MNRVEGLRAIKQALYDYGTFPKHLWHKPSGGYLLNAKVQRAEYEAWNDRTWAMIEIRGMSAYNKDRRWGWYLKEVGWLQTSLSK